MEMVVSETWKVSAQGRLEWRDNTEQAVIWNTGRGAAAPSVRELWGETDTGKE